MHCCRPKAVLAEHGHRITLPAKTPKTYLPYGEGQPTELYADIRLCVDGASSDLVLRCTLKRSKPQLRPPLELAAFRGTGLPVGVALVVAGLG